MPKSRNKINVFFENKTFEYDSKIVTRRWDEDEEEEEIEDNEKKIKWCQHKENLKQH